MNKELILKYKIEFDHSLYGGKLQVKFVNDPWEEAPEDIFSYSTVNFVLVIDDEYVEFRRALAEGKTIQHISATTGEWVDFNKRFEPTPSYTFLATPEYYRIKLEEPAFKVGDWVRDIITNKTHQVKNEDICNGKYSQVVKWNPQPGEWCWFWNNDKQPFLAQLESADDEEYITVQGLHGSLADLSDACFSFEYYEPFIGELPTHLKAN